MTARTTYDLTAAEVIVFCGDSLTHGGIVGAGGTSIPWWWYVPAYLNSVRNPAINCRAAAGGSLTYPAGITLGFSGTTMSKFTDPTVTAAILALNPTIVVPCWGVNDATAGTAPNTVASQLITGCQALLTSNSALKIPVFGVCNNGECWPDPTVLNPFDPQIDAINGALSSACDTLSASAAVSWLNPRPMWMARIQVLNPSNVQNGHHLTVDNLHDNVSGSQLKGSFFAGQAVRV